MGRGSFRLKGQICYSLDKDHIRTVKEGTVVCVDGISQGFVISRKRHLNNAFRLFVDAFQQIQVSQNHV